MDEEQVTPEEQEQETTNGNAPPMQDAPALIPPQVVPPQQMQSQVEGPSGQTQQPDPEQIKAARDQALDFHPAVTQAHLLRKVGETLAGGPQIRTTIDPETGTVTREKQPLSTRQILLGALANVLGGGGQIAGNLSNRMAGRAPKPVQPLPSQVAQQQQAAQAQEDYNQQQTAKIQKAKVLNANLEAMRTGYAIGKEDDDAKDSVINNHKDDLEQWNKAGAVEASNIPSDQLLAKGFDKSKYVAIPDGRVPVLNADGQRVTDSNGVPLSQLTYSVVDGTTQTPLTQDKYNELSRFGLMQSKQGFNLPEGSTISSATLALMNHKLDLINQTQREIDEVAGPGKVDLAAKLRENPSYLKAIESFHNDGASTEPDNQINNLQAKNPAAAGLMRDLFGNKNLEDYKENREAQIAAKKTAATETARVNAEAQTPEGQQKLINQQQTGEKNKLEIEKLKHDVEQFSQNSGDQTLEGFAYLNTLPPDQKSLVQGIGTGKIGMNRLDYLVTRKPEVLEAVTRAYPDFDSTKVKNYIDTSKDFTAGKTSQELVAGSTALMHLNELHGLNTLQSRVPGTVDYQRYENKVDTVAPELARFYGNNTEKGIESYKKTLNALLNRDAAIQTQAQSMGDRFDSYEQKWKNAAPSAAYQGPLPGVSDAAKQARAALDPRYAQRYQQERQQPNPQQATNAKQQKLQAITLPGGGHPVDIKYGPGGVTIVSDGKQWIDLSSGQPYAPKPSAGQQ